MNPVIFITDIVHHYPPEYISLYLLLGLGVAGAKLEHGEKVKVSFSTILIGIPVGILMGLCVVALFPVYVAAAIYNKLTR